ncbi:MAG: hypothetical protein K2M55_08040 [Muribaculaceae bacterium]|nr:hypothetical protein [Muribaculaceae bacterium]
MLQRLQYLCTTLVALALPMLASAYNADYYVRSSALAEGHWVKLDVDTTGIYEVSYEQLQQWGFSNPAAVKVYGYGGVLPTVQDFTSPYKDDVPPTATYHTSDGRLLFYGVGPLGATMSDAETLSLARNTYDNAGHYFLSDAVTDYTTPVREFAQAPDTKYGERNWHYSLQVIEREVENPGHGGTIFHGPQLAPGDSESFDFSVRDFGWNHTSVPFGVVHVQPAANWNMLTDFKVSVSDEIPVAQADITQYPAGLISNATRMFSYGDIRALFRPTEEHPVSDTGFSVTVTLPANFGGTYAAVNAAYLVYPRFNRLHDESELSMVIRDRDNQLQTFTVEGGHADVQVWNVTNPVDIYAYAMSREADGTVRGVLDDEFKTPQTLVAFNPSATHRAPKYAGVVANQNLHSLDTPEYLIVTTETMKPYAEELAEIHRSHGRSVLVCSQDDIANEYGSGSLTPAAVRRFVKMFYDRDGQRLGSILMYGSATFDYRNILTLPSDALITFQCEYPEHASDNSTNYATDHYFGIVADNATRDNLYYTTAQIPVGRIPADNAQLARQYNAKSKAYLDNPPSAAVALRILKFSDDGDSGKHFEYSEKFADTLRYSGNYTLFRADNLLYPITNKSNPDACRIIDNSLKRGVNLVYYTGHGDSHSVTAEDLWNSQRVKTLSYRNPPVAFMASCDAYPFDREHGALIETMVCQPEGGMIGAIGACRSVYMGHNQTLSLAFRDCYMDAKPGTTAARLLMEARNATLYYHMNHGLGANNFCFNYCGDPALPLVIPTYDMVLDELGGGDYRSGVPMTLKAHVTDGDKLVKAFNGRALIEVYDAPTMREKRRGGENGDSIIIATCDENLLAEYPVNIVGGTIETTVILPEPAIEGLPFRIVLTATDSDSGLIAAGTFRGDVLQAEEEVTDVADPEILNFAAVSDPDLVPGSVRLVATIVPPASGLAVGNSGVRSGIDITIDGKTRYNEVRNMISYTDYGLAEIEFTLLDQSFGPHTASLTVSGNNGRVVHAVTGYEVEAVTLPGTLTIDEADPVRNSATFEVESAGEVRRLIIVDSRGNTVYSAANPAMPFTWNLRDNDGKTVADGHYRAWTILESDQARGASNIVEFIVVK